MVLFRHRFFCICLLLLCFFKWGKHTPAKFRGEHSTERASAIHKDYILPVVTIRHPYTWFHSMCKNGYTARWDHHKTGKDGTTRDCPKFKVSPSRGINDDQQQEQEWNQVTVTYANDRDDHHLSLAHLWNDWYSYYFGNDPTSSIPTTLPFVVVRMEDLVFYPEETTRIVCECAGGEIRTDAPFSFVVDSAKADSPGHDKSTGILAAWMKYAKPPPPQYGLSRSDYEVAKQVLNEELMMALGYQHPPPE
jgi:hypothetical protein